MAGCWHVIPHADSRVSDSLLAGDEANARQGTVRGVASCSQLNANKTQGFLVQPQPLTSAGLH